jgi:hypothetical protein
MKPNPLASVNVHTCDNLRALEEEADYLENQDPVGVKQRLEAMLKEYHDRLGADDTVVEQPALVYKPTAATKDPPSETLEEVLNN